MTLRSGDLSISTNISGVVSSRNLTQTQAVHSSNFLNLDAYSICPRIFSRESIGSQSIAGLSFPPIQSANSIIYAANSEEINESNINQAFQKRHPLSAFLGVWKGNDLEQMLKMVHKTRSQL